MQVTMYEFTAKMACGDYVDNAFKLHRAGENDREAIINLVADIVTELQNAPTHDAKLAMANGYIAEKLDSDNWTAEQFCDDWMELWIDDVLMFRVWDMKPVCSYEAVPQSRLVL